MFSKKIIKRDDGQPYLIRWHLFTLFGMKFRLHHILLSDYDCLHDHPWNFVSIILKGGYWEHTNQIILHHPSGKRVYKNCKWYPAGSVLFRNAEFQHSLELKLKNLKEGFITSWSLVIMFNRKREWGFWTRAGFVHWSKYDSKQKCD